MFKRVMPDEIRRGEPLSTDVYNSEGRCIFRKGFIFQSEQSLARIQGMELYRKQGPETDAPTTSQPKNSTPVSHHVPVPDRSTSTAELKPRRRKVMYEYAHDQQQADGLIQGNLFRFIDNSIATLGDISERITGGATDQLGRLNILIENLIRGYKLASDPCLGAMHLEYEHPLSNLQPVYTAFGCLAMAEALKLSAGRIYSLVGAALTANLGMYSHFDLLVNRSSPLDDEEIAFLHNHPVSSHKMLRDNFVQDEVWLKIVLQHHERGDGSGYPNKFKREQIILEASILGAVDTYIAMITPRAYRKALIPKHAMQNMYKTAVAKEDIISIGLIKEFGIYPPGSLVRLANQEIAVVLGRNRGKPTEPQVAAIAQQHGHTYDRVILRDTASPAYQIVDAFLPQEPIEIDLDQLWRSDIGIEFSMGDIRI